MALRCFVCRRDVEETGAHARAILRQAYQALDESTGEAIEKEREQAHLFHEACLAQLQREGRRPGDPATTRYTVLSRTAFTAAFQRLVRDRFADSVLVRAAVIPVSEASSRWMAAALDEGERDADTDRQRFWRGLLAEIPRLQREGETAPWAAPGGVELVTSVYTREALNFAVDVMMRRCERAEDATDDRVEEDAAYLTLLWLYASQGPELAREAWRCRYLGPYADEEISRRATELGADGRPTPRAHGIKLAFLAGTMLAAQQGRLRMVKREQADALATLGEWFQQDSRTQELLKEMKQRADEPSMPGALLLHPDLAAPHSNDVHRLLAFALDGGLDSLARRVRQGVEREFLAQQKSLDRGARRENERGAMEWMPTEVPDTRDEGEALYAQVFVAGLKSGRLSVAQVLEWDDDTLRMLVAVFAVDLDRWLRARDRALVALGDAVHQLSDAEAEALGYGTARQAQRYYAQIQASGLESPHARLVERYLTGDTFNEIGDAIGLSHDAIGAHRNRIVRFLCRQLVGGEPSPQAR
jgi:hypothetical protein